MTPRMPSGGYRVEATAAAACSAEVTIGKMIDCAPQSKTRFTMTLRTHTRRGTPENWCAHLLASRL
eukprot:6183215-Pleurochrysis_carterae.AAC.4